MTRKFSPKHNLPLFFFVFFFFITSSLNLWAQNCPTISHNPYTDFNSSKPFGVATTLWLNLHTKLSGQLANNGDYLWFSGGSLTLSGITASWATAAIPDGKIIADNTVSKPVTYFDIPANTWITKVPLGYSSGDIFLTAGATISSTGYTVGSGKKSIFSGQMYSNIVSFSSSWFYGLACYQPTFTCSDVAAPGVVTSIGGGLKAGTPTTMLKGLVPGGSGGGGSNFTGSNSSTDNFTTIYGMPCTITVNPPIILATGLKSKERTVLLNSKSEIYNISLNLLTNAGTEADYFNVQKRNTVTGNFETLEIIKNTTSNNPLQVYSAYDNVPFEGDNYYRVEMVLNDGTKIFSEETKVNFKLEKGFVVFPNPTSDYINVNLKDYSGKDVIVYLYNQMGVVQAVHSVQNAGSTPAHIDLANLSGGQYLLRVVSEGYKDMIKPVIVQK